MNYTLEDMQIRNLIFSFMPQSFYNELCFIFVKTDLTYQDIFRKFIK
jgi:hypothetical protein